MLPTERPTYRADIDGLRALAVLPVLAYHAGIAGVTGGYIGVDVFFVISGFLITGIITRGIDSGTFSLRTFYERRARRILPALFAVIAASLAAAAWLYLPGDFEAVPPSALAAVLFAGNVWFFTQTGYFQGGTETMPLLHTWSLGVEEQFYIIFPLVLIVLARMLPNWRRAAILSGFAVSFVWAWWVQDAGDGFAFFMLPTRAWELLAGSALALGYVPAIRSRLLAELGAGAGLAMILAPTFLYDLGTVFPGLTAVPPVLGAESLIHCAPGTVTGAALSRRVPVLIGALSYSLYLWHWPLIVFTRYAQDAPLTGWQPAALIAISIAAAWLSWRFIETPLRTAGRLGRLRTLGWSAGGMAALALVCAVLVSLGPWDSRFAPRVTALAAGKHDVSPLRAQCLTAISGAPPAACTIGAGRTPTAMVWGDSHGVELAWALGERLRGGDGAGDGGAVLQRTRPSCPPVLGWTSPSAPGCTDHNAAVLAEIAATPSLKTVYLAGYWASDRYRSARTARQLDRTTAQLQQAGKQVVFIAPVPAQPFNVPRRLARAAAGGYEAEMLSAAQYAQQSAWVRAQFPAWRARGVRILDPADTLVAGPRTVIVAGGKSLYFDSHHLSLAGARKVLAAEAR